MNRISSSKKVLCLVLLAAATLKLNANHAYAESPFNDITRVSQSAAAILGNNDSTLASISGDGRYVAFQSSASNLVSAATQNSGTNIYLKDRTTGLVSRVSQTEVGTEGNKSSANASISKDGSFVAFESLATNLASVTDSNDAADIFVKEIATGTLTLESINTSSVPSNAESSHPVISADGRYVAFQSRATNLVGLTDITEGNDIFLRDRQAGTTTRVSANSQGTQGNGESLNPAMSADGRFIAFESKSSNLSATSGDVNNASDLFIYDSTNSQVTLESVNSLSVQGNDASTNPSISDDGRFLAFQSTSTNLITAQDTNGVTDIFLRDRTSGTTVRISQSPDGAQANGASIKPVISGDGSQVIFLSSATNLTAASSNTPASENLYNVYVYTVSTAAVHSVSLSFQRKQQPGLAIDSDVNYNGTVFAFTTSAALISAPHSFKQVFAADEACTNDRDTDGVPTCSDECPDDITKSTAGDCGCGVADTDTDADGTKNCNDLCLSDSTKVAPGTCGCGVSDADDNGNGIPDCKDPLAKTVPTKPALSLNKARLTIAIPSEFSKVTYKIIIRRGTRVIKKVTTTKNLTTVSLPGSGTYKVSYRVALSDIVSRQSKSVQLKVR